MVRKAQGSPAKALPAPAEHGMFEGVRAVFVEGGILGKRIEIWKKRLIGLGGQGLDPGKRIPREATHVLAADAERLIKHYGREQVEESPLFLVSFAWLEESLAQGKLLPPNAYRVFSSSRSASTGRSPARSRSASPDTAQSRGGHLVEAPQAGAHPPAPKTPATSAQKRLREAHERAEDLAAEVQVDNKRRRAVALVGGEEGAGDQERREGEGGQGLGLQGDWRPGKGEKQLERWGEVRNDVTKEKEDMGIRPLGLTAEAIGREIMRIEPPRRDAIEQPAHSGGGSDEDREISQRAAKRTKIEGPDSKGPQGGLERALVEVNEEGFLDLRENQTPAGMANPELNRGLLKVLGELKDIYRDAFGDDRRSFSYYKAISVVENLSFKVTSAEQLKGLPSIGRSLLDVVRDILGTGTTPRLEALKNDPMVRALFEFGSVWGIGPVTARKLYDMGYRKLEELEKEPSLTQAQRTGVKFFFDIQQRIPRHEAAEMEAIVQRVATELCPGIEVLCGGSYRRGKATCGDMDMVLTHPDGHSHKGLLPKLVAKLKEIDFVTEDLLVGPIHSAEDTNHGVDTYFGLCKYPGRELRHRIDFKVYPRDQHAFGLMAWTGNDVLNRRLRLIASAQQLHLNDHGMYPAIYREGNSVHNVSRGSESVPCYTEMDIFRTLRVRYLEPTERNL